MRVVTDTALLTVIRSALEALMRIAVHAVMRHVLETALHSVAQTRMRCVRPSMKIMHLVEERIGPEEAELRGHSGGIRVAGVEEAVTEEARVLGRRGDIRLCRARWKKAEMTVGLRVHGER